MPRFLSVALTVTYGGGAHWIGMADFAGGYTGVGAALGMIAGLMLAGLPGVVAGTAVGAVIGWYLGKRRRE